MYKFLRFATAIKYLSNYLRDTKYILEYCKTSVFYRLSRYCIAFGLVA